MYINGKLEDFKDVSVGDPDFTDDYLTLGCGKFDKNKLEYFFEGEISYLELNGYAMTET